MAKLGLQQSPLEAALQEAESVSYGLPDDLKKQFEQERIKAEERRKNVDQQYDARALDLNSQKAAVTGGASWDRKLKGSMSFIQNNPDVFTGYSPEQMHWVAAISAQESAGNPNARSPVGASGFMQVMPATAAKPGYGIAPMRDNSVRENVRLGLGKFEAMMQRFNGDVDKALAAYNAGEGNVDKAVSRAQKFGGDWKAYLPRPQETIPYINNVKGYYNAIGSKGGVPLSSTQAQPTQARQSATPESSRYRPLNADELKRMEEAQAQGFDSFVPFAGAQPIKIAQQPTKHPAKQAQPQNNEDGGVLSDTGTLLLSGINSAAEGARELASRIPGVKHLVGAVDKIDEYFTGKTSQQIFDEARQKYDTALSPKTAEARKKLWVVEPGDKREDGTTAQSWDLGDAWKDPRAYYAGVVESVPEMVMSMGGSLALAKGAFRRAITSGATREVAAKKAATTATIAGGLIEGGLGGAHASVDVRKEIKSMSADMLKNSDAMKALMAEGKTFEQARDEIANDAATKAFIIAGVGTGIFGGMGDRAIAKVITKGTSSRLKSAVGGAVAEGLFEEMPQSAAQQMAQNYAVQEADPNRPLMKGVANQAAGGAVLGGIMGGGLGAAGHRSDAQPAAEAVQPAEEAPQATADTPVQDVTPAQAAQPEQQQPARKVGPIERALGGEQSLDTAIDNEIAAVNGQQAEQSQPEQNAEAAAEQADSQWLGAPGTTVQVSPKADPESVYTVTVEGYQNGEVFARDQDGTPMQFGQDDVDVAQPTSETITPAGEQGNDVQSAEGISANDQAVSDGASQEIELAAPTDSDSGTGVQASNAEALPSASRNTDDQGGDQSTSPELTDFGYTPQQTPAGQNDPNLSTFDTTDPQSVDPGPVKRVEIEQPEKTLSNMNEGELRARMKYIADQARTNGGWDKRLIAERRKVETAIGKLSKKQQDVEAPQQEQAVEQTDVATTNADAKEPTFDELFLDAHINNPSQKTKLIQAEIKKSGRTRSQVLADVRRIVDAYEAGNATPVEQGVEQKTTDKPLAADGLKSYRYKGPYGWIMIGAKDVQDALNEASRSTDDKIEMSNLQEWDGSRYVDLQSPESAPSRAAPIVAETATVQPAATTDTTSAPPKTKRTTRAKPTAKQSKNALGVKVGDKITIPETQDAYGKTVPAQAFEVTGLNGDDVSLTADNGSRDLQSAKFLKQRYGADLKIDKSSDEPPVVEAETKKATTPNEAEPENKFQKYDDVAKQYGRSVNSDGAILSNKGKDTGVRIVEKKGRVRIEQKDGKLLFSGGKPESLGKFLEDYWYDKKLRFSRADMTDPKDAETGKPINAYFARNTVSSKNYPANMDFGQDLEPAGEYMNIATYDASGMSTPGWQYGVISFKNPLVLEHKSTDSTGWKKDLSEMFDGKTGKALSAAIKKAGYDAVVTKDKYGYSETVNLSGEKARFSKKDEQPKNLFVAHNLSASNILAANDLGGLAAPSIAVARSDISDFSGFGEVTLLADPKLLEDSKIRTFDADIYSPRQPRANYDLDQKKFNAFVNELDQDGYGLRTPGYDDASSTDGAEAFIRSDAVKYKFLQEVGKAPKPKNAKVDPAIKAAAKLEGSRWNLPENPKFVAIATKHYKALVAKYTEASEARGLRMQDVYFNEDGKVQDSILRDFAAKVDSYRSSGGKDLGQLRSDINEKMRNDKLRTQFEKWATDQFNSMVTGKTLFKGFTNAGNRRYQAYTLENVVKEMTEKLQAGEGTFYGAGSVRSAYANEMKTLKNIQARRDQIVNAADMERIKEESGKVFSDALENLKPFYKYDSNSWGYMDDAGSAIAEGAKGIREAFKVTPESRKIIADLTNYLANLPTAYFEAKAQRAVQFSEFNTAVVPKGMDKDALQVLRDAGLKIKTYDPKVDGDRSRVIAQQEKLLFSQREQNGTGTTVADVRDRLIERFGKDTIARLEDQGILNIEDTFHIPDVEGYSQGGNVTLIASTLTPDTIVPVFLHELGGHVGMQGVMKPIAYKNLMEQFNRLVEVGDPIALEAKRLAEREADPKTQEVEYLPYLITVAAREQNKRPGIRTLINRIVSAVKAWAVDKLGVNINLNANDVVALAERMVSAISKGDATANPDIRFSRKDDDLAPVSSEEYASKLNQWADALKNLPSDTLTNAMQSGLGLVPLRPMLNELAKDIPAAATYLRVKDAMDSMRNKWHAKTDAVAQEWLKYRIKNKEENKELMDIMHESTLMQVDPSEDFEPLFTPRDRMALADMAADHPGRKKLEEKQAKDVDRKAAHAKLQTRFKRLSPAAQTIYHNVRDAYTDLADAFDKTLLQNMEKAINVRIKKAERDHKREMERINDEGLKDQEREDAIAAADRRLKNAKTKIAWNRKARMTQLRQQFETSRIAGPYFPLARFGNFFVTVRDKKTGEVVSFSRFEKARDQRRFFEDVSNDPNYKVEKGALSDTSATRNSVDPNFVADVEDILADLPNAEKVKDEVWQRYLESLPDMSVRKARIHRKGRAGYNADAVRAFGSQMFHGSHQLARMAHSMDLEDALDEARDQARETKDPVRSSLIVNEMDKRHQFVMSPTGGALAQWASSFAFVWYLAGSPKAAIMNLFQTPIMGVPILGAYAGGLNGMARAGKELTSALVDFTKGKGFAERSSGLTADERQAMSDGYESGIIERTQGHDLAGVGETGVEYSAARERAMKIISWGFHHAERLNREVTFLAAYRLARSKGLTHEAAVTKAGDLTWKSHFDYSNTSRPRFMHNDTMKILLVFRNFQINMLYRLFRDVHQMVNGETKEVRREAFTQLAGITAMMMLNAGITGTWLFGIALVMAGMFMDDGEDPEEELKKAMIKVVGPQLAGVALHGVPGYVTGTSLSESVGMPDLWFRSPDSEKEGQEALQFWQSQLLGAVPSIGAQFVSGLDKIKKDEEFRGIETMMPKMLKDPMKAYRYATEGATNMRGDIVTDVTFSDVVKQALGFTPARIAEQYKINNASYNMQQAIMKERKQIMEAYYKADNAGDEKKLDELEKKIDKYNEKNPEQAITARSLIQSRKNRDKGADNAVGGMRYNTKLRDRIMDEQAPTIYGE